MVKERTTNGEKGASKRERMRREIDDYSNGSKPVLWDKTLALATELNSYMHVAVIESV